MSLLGTAGGRRLLFTALYLSEGAPIGFLWWALPPKLRLAGVSVAEITALTSALVLPWTFKFVWAPLIDRYRLPRVGLRIYIIAAQACMGLTLLPLLYLDFVADLDRIFMLLIAHAFAAATQDVAVDALAVSTVAPSERGKLNGFMQTGMLAGRALFGGGALLLEQRFGMPVVILMLLGLTWSSLILVLWSLRSDEPASEASDSQPGFVAALGRALLTRASLLGLGFALLSGAGFEAVGAVAGALLVDRGAAQDAVGFFFAVPVVLAMIFGALAGGYLTDRFERLATVRATLLLFSLAVLCLSLLDALGVRGNALFVSLALVYVGIGAFVAASYALFMDLTERRVAATQISAFMGATNACEAWSGFAVGRMVAPLGYGTSFTLLTMVSLCALGLLARLRAQPRG